MPVLNYEVSADELKDDFVQVVKTLFKGKKVRISIQEEATEKNGAGKPKQTLSEIIAEREGDPVRYVVPGEVFSVLADSFLENEKFDIVSEIKKYKVERP
ncbi:MAG: hypothetical protein KF734_02250 [Saprospiraceae bacterium]|nr:hypothetical protein [Saprospiraceae bacterium]